MTALRVFGRLVLSLAVAIAAVALAIFIQQMIAVRESQAITGLAGAAAAYLMWRLTGPRKTGHNVKSRFPEHNN